MLIRPDERIVFFGDSLTCRTDLLDSADPARRYSLDYAGSYVDILVKRLLIHFPQLPFTFYNAGVGGDTVDRLLARYEQDVLPLSPTMMILWVGQNDAKALCEERFAQQLHLLLQNCRRDHIQTVVLSTSAHRSHQKMRALERIDFILRQQSDEMGCPYIDVKAPMVHLMQQNRQREWQIQLFTTGSHLSELGNLLVADTVFEQLKEREW